MAGPSRRPSRSPGRSPVTTAPPTTPSGYDPTELQSAYNLGGAPSSGTGETVAIVDAYNDPDALSNLSTYRAEWGLPAVCGGTTTTGCAKVTVENQSGGTRLPSSNVGWSEEISVDLDMVSAICPDCNILLVEASSPTFSNLGAAELTAAAAHPVSIGNSYGGAESSSETSYDSYYGSGSEKGIAITAATGDDGYGVEYPAASPDVIAVGGTTLSPVSSPPEGGRAWAETAWANAGSGCSGYEAQPLWQTHVVPSACTNRAVADVAAVANPSTGVAVYDSYGLNGWTVFGGTSVATQVISAIYARGTSPVSAGAGQLYAAASSSYATDFYDVTSGSNGSCSVPDLCTAGTGWDGPTGLGTPNGAGAFWAVARPIRPPNSSAQIVRPNRPPNSSAQFVRPVRTVRT